MDIEEDTTISVNVKEISKTFECLSKKCSSDSTVVAKLIKSEPHRLIRLKKNIVNVTEIIQNIDEDTKTQ